MKIVVFTQVQTNQLGMYFFFFFEGKGLRQLELLLVEAANGVTPAIQGLNICSRVLTPRTLGRGIYPQDSRGGR